MNKNSLIGAVILTGALVTANDFIRNTKEEIKIPEVKAKQSIITLDENYLKELTLETEEEKISIETNYESYTICSGTKVYSDEFKTQEITLDRMMKVSLISTKGNMALIILENGISCYTYTSSLIKNVDLYTSEYTPMTESNMVILTDMTKVYDSTGSYLQSRDVNTKCYVTEYNSTYAHVIFEDGLEGYVEIPSLMFLSAKVNGYAYVRNLSPTYADKELTSERGNIFAGEIVYVAFINGNSAYITNDNGESFYMNTQDLDSNYIMVNLTDQKMYCFLNYQLACTYGTRSGRDSSPTHTGDYDIDWKAENWEFTNFPGSRAKHWIPINEYGEGLHDLVGDDEANYGNNLYHDYGSHGCIRIPSAASQFVYDNYEVGDMVLVRKR